MNAQAIINECDRVLALEDITAKRDAAFPPLSAQVLARALKIAVTALNESASWGEGKKVSAGFDCPVHAKASRAALKEIAAQFK